VKSGRDAKIYWVNSIPVSWLASDGGLTADLVLAGGLDSHVGAAEGCDLLILLFVGAKLAREGGLPADLFWRMNSLHM
jgi:hypothetical protein